MTDTIESGPDSGGISRRSRRSRRSLLAVLAAPALVVAVASGAALADDGSDANGPLPVSAAGPASPSPRGEDGDGRTDGFRGRGHALGHGFGHKPMLRALALHGTFVVPDGDGGYRTVVTQRGEVTAVSDTSLTLRSKDGFDATYRLTGDTDVLGGTGRVGDIAQGDKVGVAAGRKGAVNTATHVVDMERPGAPRLGSP